MSIILRPAPIFASQPPPTTGSLHCYVLPPPGILPTAGLLGWWLHAYQDIFHRPVETFPHHFQCLQESDWFLHLCICGSAFNLAFPMAGDPKRLGHQLFFRHDGKVTEFLSSILEDSPSLHHLLFRWFGRNEKTRHSELLSILLLQARLFISIKMGSRHKWYGILPPKIWPLLSTQTKAWPRACTLNKAAESLLSKSLYRP